MSNSLLDILLAKAYPIDNERQATKASEPIGMVTWFFDNIIL
nr:MAG TPA: hypothetical protein [Caudoviricetes sp.]